jgi:thiol-disulfide isomerase/thioredoxin
MRALAFFAIAAALAGCAKESAPPAAPAPARPASKAATADYRPVALTTDWKREVQLVPVSHDQWVRELDALEGRIVVVDNWATWCAPCVERFPAMMEMARAWAPSGVVFVTMSLDDRDDPETLPKVRAFLAGQDARIPNYLMDEIVPDAFEKLGLLGIPAVHVYDRTGKRTHELTGDDPNAQFTEADVDAAIRSLVQRP